MQKKHVAIILLFFFLISTFTIVGLPMAATTTNLVLSTTEQEFQATETESIVYFYLDSTTPLTVRYLAENPDYAVSLTVPYNHSIYLGATNYFESYYTGWTDVPISFSDFETVYTADTTNAQWDEPIGIAAKLSTRLTSFTVSANVDLSEDTETTDPTDPEHGGGGTEIEEDDNSGLISGIVDGIGGFFEWIWEQISTFFSELFKPITDFIAEWKERLESEDNAKSTFWGSLTFLFDKVSGYTLDPILEFADDILDIEAIALVLMFWDIPILKEFTLAAIFVIVIIAFFALITTI